MFHVKHHLSRLAIGVSRETSSRGLLACWPMWARLRADVTSLWAGSVALLNSSVEHFGRDCDDGRMPAESQNSPAHPLPDAGSDDSAGPALHGVLAAPAPPSVAEQVFAERLDVAQRYAAHLADTGISHGLIGPREVPRLWERHILNCAVIAEVIPEGASVIDVGSGAGLPGLCLALARPDLAVTLVEPMERRTTWLEAVRDDLALESVVIIRARADELHGKITADVVTARAVAALDKLARWCLPLVTPGGRMVAMKGSSASREITAAAKTLRPLGGQAARIVECGHGVVEPPTTVVIVDTSATSVRRATQRDSKGRSKRRR